MSELEIIYLDDHFVAVNKPPGLLVHRTDLDPHETEFAVQTLRNQLKRYVWPIHRLDKPTSGVLLFCLNQQMAVNLTESFQEGSVKKTYYALVRGWMEEEVTVDRGVRFDKMKPRKEALTKFHLWKKFEIDHAIGPYETSRYSLIRAVPATGRRHQIRKHLNHISHPIIGDSWYGDRDHNRFFKDHIGISGLFLHAAEISFPHPETGKEMRVVADLPDFWTKALTWLGFEDIDLHVEK